MVPYAGVAWGIPYAGVYPYMGYTICWRGVYHMLAYMGYTTHHPGVVDPSRVLEPPFATAPDDKLRTACNIARDGGIVPSPDGARPAPPDHALLRTVSSLCRPSSQPECGPGPTRPTKASAQQVSGQEQSS
jgi:hypothetical protein